MLQATHPLCSPPVESLKNFPALLDLGTVLRRWHHQSRVRREDNFPQPAAGFAPFNSSHDSTGLPGHMNTLLAPWFVAPHSATDFCVSHCCFFRFSSQSGKAPSLRGRYQPRTSCTTQSLPLQPLVTGRTPENRPYNSSKPPGKQL